MELLVLRLISCKEELGKLASSMKTIALKNPIEPNVYLNRINEDEHVSSVNEHDTGMMVAKSKRMLSAVRPFTAHITFDRKITYQLQYWIYEECGEFCKMAQLSLIRMDKGPLEVKVVTDVLQAFFDPKDQVSPHYGTPGHVGIIFHKIKNEK